MSAVAEAARHEDTADVPRHSGPPVTGRYLALLALGAIGVVYGDIGTSPLYALTECFHSEHGVTPTPGNVLGVLSLVFWALTLVVSLKYLIFIMRADNHGEGGILALTALATPIRPTGRSERRWLVILGLFGAALLYGDGIITPAISVLSAVEGLSVATPRAQPFVIPLSVAIIVGLFLFQKGGTAKVGKIFGPIMVVWFAVLALLGVVQILHSPSVLGALNPLHGLRFFEANGLRGFLVLGSVVLVVTGGEALYADMGHFGRRPIRYAWFALVYPALLLNYFGQGALLLHDPKSSEHPFFNLAPGWALIPLVLLSTVATVIASQAVISGAFSLTLQAIQLGFCPRLQVRHTSEHEFGQVYVPAVNWALLVACVLLIVSFRSSTNLAAAYGIAVTSTMAITSVIFYVVAHERWGWPLWQVVPLVGVFMAIDLSFLGANLVKVLEGGWLPLAVAALVFTILATWKRGRRLVFERNTAVGDTVAHVVERVQSGEVTRVPGTAVFLSGTPAGAPISLLHNLKHNKIAHAQTVLATVKTLQVPNVQAEHRVRVESLGDGFYRAEVRFGFMEDPHLARALESDVVRDSVARQVPGLVYAPGTATYFVNRDRVVPTELPGMALWREHLFAGLSRVAATAADYFGLPPDRSVEIGNVVEI
ncbi:putative potassium transport system protein kup 1 [Gemmatimonadetes bacterium T265]|nr:putative potassium transport system protein kup 1 [Gemmatimonadetes bacterium T265]